MAFRKLRVGSCAAVVVVAAAITGQAAEGSTLDARNEVTRNEASGATTRVPGPCDGAAAAAGNSGAQTDPAPGSFLTDDASQQAVVALNAVVTKDAGVQAVAVDVTNRRLVVVLEPGQGLAPASDAAINSAKRFVPIEIVNGRVSKEDLLVAKRSLEEAAEKTPTARAAGLGIGMDWLAGKVVVNGGAESAQAVLDASGVPKDLVSVESTTAFRRVNRTVDYSPHHGGADIRIYSAPFGSCLWRCTSGFTVVNGYGVRSTTTAGHCGQYPNFAASVGGPVEGWLYRAGSYPAVDIAAVYVSSESYANRIYTDPGAPTVRTVTASKIPNWAETGCVSGAVTLAICGAILFDVDYTHCDLDGCTYHLDRWRREDGATICQPGDSGAPLYQRTGGSNATIVGSLVACSWPPGDTALSHDVGTLLWEAGIAVATS